MKDGGERAAVPPLRERYGPWALVAGGSEGVGRALAKQLAEAGVHLLLVARTAATLEALAAELRVEHPGVEVDLVAVDLATEGAVAQIAAAVGEREVGLLVLNAGANTLRGAFLDLEPADVDGAVRLSVHLPLALVRRLVPGMVSRGRGAVLSIGSLAGYLGQPDLAVYSAGKAWQRLLCESLWLELAPYGVDVLHLVLGLTRTPAMERAGLSFDVPGVHVSTAETVAAVALANLGHGPVVVVPGNDSAVLARSGTDRARLVSSTARRMARVIPQNGGRA